MSHIPPPPVYNESGKIDLLEIQRRITAAKSRIQKGIAGIAPPRSPSQNVTKNKSTIPKPAQGSSNLKTMPDNGIIPKRDLQTSKESKPPSNEKQLHLEAPSRDFKDPSKNPFFDPSLEAKSGPAGRRMRPLKFVEPGKYIKKAEKQRAEEQLKRLKEMIAQSASKVGVAVELDITDKAIKKDQPPEVEWWDAPFLPNKTYQDLEREPLNVEKLDTLVTVYVHHPVPIDPPNEKNLLPLRSMMLTKKERKKLRRQRRQETQKDKQDKIRLGLLPPDPPKVRLSNLMRVVGNEAIQDPTKIETRVRKEMELRRKMHEMANAQRRQTPEERRAKILAKIREDQRLSIGVAVFKVKNLTHPKHRYKVEMNTNQLGLSGVTIIHPKCHLVIVEGGHKSIKAFKKLMLRRMDWNDMPLPRNSNPSEGNDFIQSDGENRCYLVWEGQVKDKVFGKMTWERFESEKMARSKLAEKHAEHYWDAAVLASDEELAARQPDLQ